MIEYNVIRSNRKTVALEISAECKLLVRAPLLMPEGAIKSFISKHQKWIEQSILKQQKRAQNRRPLSALEINELKKLAAEILPKRIEYFSSLTKLKPTGIKITSAQKRFGSCNGKNSICFSYILMKYPIEAIDYVVLHELIHIKHHNHSREFWKEVEKYMPDYKARRQLLRD